MKKRKVIVASVVLLLVFLVGGVVAYFTDTDSETNTFTIGNIEIDVIEDKWKENDAKDLMPGQIVNKDPVIKNISRANSAYLFMKVEAPCTEDTPALELFPFTAHTDWYLMTDGSCTQGKITRVYAYGTSTAMKPVGAGSSTTALFKTVTVNDELEGDETGIDGNLDMIITGYGVQVDGIDATKPEDVWNVGEF